MTKIEYKIYIDDIVRRVEYARLRVSDYHIVKTVAISKYSTSDEIEKLYEIGQRAFEIKMDNVASQVRQAFLGTVVQRVQRGNEEVKVVVSYPAEERNSLWYLENMNIRLPDGSGIPLLTIADVDYGEGPVQIRRTNRKRVMRVRANVDPEIADSARIMQKVEKEILPNLEAKWGLAGVQQNADDFKKYLFKGYVLALLVMYILMAILFKSYLQPLMIMFAIPFGLIGALIGHLVVGIDVTLWSLIGMCAVSGVVVNDNLVMVDYINRKCKENMPMMEAIRAAGGARFRPIVLTSITTFGGLAPLMVEKSIQAQFLIPMAVSLAFGVLFATFVTLILVPSTYHILEDIRALTKRYLPKEIFQHEAQSGEGESSNSISSALKAANEKLQENLQIVPDFALDAFSLDTVGAEEVSGLEPTLEASAESDQLRGEGNNWNDDLDGAYDRGYELGLQGKEGEQSAYESEEMTASWEAGYDDGLEAYELKRQT